MTLRRPGSCRPGRGHGRSGASGSPRCPRGAPGRAAADRRLRRRARRRPGDRAARSPPRARRLGLTVDQLADRTRIRPHVIEAIEVDDFTACGGDFYARGHLRTLARVLGVDVAPLLATYDERYADAPINPRRVFEAELATGAHGPIRGTRGGPNWSVLVAAVMALVLRWSVARLIMDSPVELQAAPVLNGVGGGRQRHRRPPRRARGPAVPVVLTAAGGGAQVVVRDGTGKVVFAGDLAFGDTRTLQVCAPGPGPVERRVAHRHHRRPGAGRPRRDRAAGAGHLRRRRVTGVTGRRRRSGRVRAETAYSAEMTQPDDRMPATADRPLSVALVTLGCARNEVDSEELAGRLAADGFRLVADPEDAETVVVNTCGFVEAAKKDSRRHAAAGRRPEGRGAHPGGRGRRLPRRALRQGPRRVAARGRRRARLRRLPRHRGPAPVDPGGGDAPPAHAAGPPHAAADHAGRARRRRSDDISVPGLPAGPRAVRRRLDGGPMAPLKLASGCDRRCSFCAIPSFRGSFVSRRPSDVLGRGPRGWPAQGVRRCSWSARTPRPTARTSATCGCSRPCCPSWRRSTASSGCGSPTSSPPRPGPAWSRRSRRTPGSRRTSTSRSSTPAPSVLRRMRRFGDPETLPRAARAGARPRARGRRALQRDRRLPRRDRGRPRRPSATSWSRPGSTSPACSATPTRTAPRPRRTTASSTTTRSGPGSST